MLRLASALWIVVFATLALSAPPAHAAYADDAVAAWQDGDPVFVSPDSGALALADAAALRERIDGWRDDVFVAVLPASAIRQDPDAAADDAGEASALIDDLYEGMGEADGIYVVNLSGAGTYAAGYGDAEGAGEVGQIMADEVADHTLGQVDQILEGTLDELGAPASEGNDGRRRNTRWTAVGFGIGVAFSAVVFLVYRVRKPRRPQRRPNGELWAGPADYRPTFTVYGEESDTVEDRAALAREDVTRLGEELDAADPPLTDPAVAAHVQSALDAYADASRRVDALTTDAELRSLAQVTEYSRWQLACAQARLAGTPPPERRLPCFVDAAHGVSVADVSWAPPGGTLRPVPVCPSCYARLTEGHT